MIFQAVDFLKILADIVGAILNFLQPIVSPIGAWMVNWIDVALHIFPTDGLTLYIVIFVALIVSGALINIKWPGDKPPKYLREKYEEKKFLEEHKKDVPVKDDISDRENIKEE
jgi:hypothetical protein